MATSRSEQTGPRGSTGVSATVSTVAASRAAPTAARALRVVELLASDPARAWRLAEIKRRLDFSHGNPEDQALRSTPAAPVGSPTSAVPSARRGP